MKDLLGRKIEIGDYLAHGARSGNSGKISVAFVEDIIDDKVKAVKCDVDSWNGRRNYFRSTLTIGSQLLKISPDTLPDDVKDGFEIV